MTLYEITNDLLRLLQFAELEDVDAEALKDTFEAIEGVFEDKAEGYAMVIAELKADIEKLAAEAKRLTDRKKVIENNVARMEDVLFNAMKTTGKEKFKTAKYSFTIANNGGKQPLRIDGVVPSDFMKQPEPVPDNEKIREYLENNTCEWAHLEERGQSLRIK